MAAAEEEVLCVKARVSGRRRRGSGSREGRTSMRRMATKMELPARAHGTISTRSGLQGERKPGSQYPSNPKKLLNAAAKCAAAAIAIGR